MSEDSSIDSSSGMRGGWVTSCAPVIFNINDIKSIERGYFQDEAASDTDIDTGIQITFNTGSNIMFIYPDVETREEKLEILQKYLRRSKSKIVRIK